MAGRREAGGNTRHAPSSCLKKKITSDPAGREDSMHT